MTKTDEIFRGNCPYDNFSQTLAKRLTFVCSAGMLRSPTAQVVATSMGYNARACGSDFHYALIPLSVHLIEWSHKIIFMQQNNYLTSIKTFQKSGLAKTIKEKSIVWEIEDIYNWGDNILFNIIREKMLKLQEEGVI